MIAPTHAPLPVPSNFPFQFSSGSQTSNLISESLVGFDVAATRQNAGRSLKLGGGPNKPARLGRVNPPAGTFSASVIVVFGRLSEESFSQSWAATGRDRAATAIGNSSNW